MEEVSGALAAALRTAAGRAEAAWPAFFADADAYTAHLVTLVRGDAEPEAGVARLAAEDLYLAFACARGVPAAISALDAGYLRELAPALRKMGLDTPAIDETLQIVRDELLVAREGHAPRILNYGGRGHLRGWLRSVMARTALRDRKHPERQDELIEGSHATPSDDLELAFMKKTYGVAFERAFARALAQIAVEDRLLLKQRFGHHLGVVELGKLYAVNAGTISRRVTAARERLVETTRALMVTELGVKANEISSIFRMIESQLAISLSVLK